MYAPGQIVYGLESLKPVQIGEDIWDNASYPEKTIHFVPCVKNIPREFGSSYGSRWSFCPSSTEKASEALALGLIKPGERE